MRHQVSWNEDGSCTVLARVTARNGSGSVTGVNGEGNWLQIANVSTITCKVFDVDDLTTAAATPIVTVSAEILDTPITVQTIWTKDATGYNFIHDLAATNFPTGNQIYRVEYTFTLSGGAVFHLLLEGVAKAIAST